ncbi:hypothetical protein M0H32_15985 [Roseibium sp. CAU 1639]|uniref:Uncharacterized protein n=1 Tax=Roseibium sediminicola TaxID=2933272 RepID=A0ABT0GW52_9HYPH|nr:hypothetical protein [Roseibium sp. CAU 1639]
MQEKTIYPTQGFAPRHAAAAKDTNESRGQARYECEPLAITSDEFSIVVCRQEDVSDLWVIGRLLFWYLIE